jgi:hypothetical protein
MNAPSDPTRYPPPEPERVERALTAMRERRTKLRRTRIVAATVALAAAVVAVAAVASVPNGTHLRVEGPSSAETNTAPSVQRPATTASGARTTSGPTTTTSTTTAVGRSATQEITYQPFTTTGGIDPNLRVTVRATGSCIRYGVTGRSQYRCFANPPAGGIYDPCFVGPLGATSPLVCPSDPVTPDVVAFSATATTGEAPMTSAHPWAMQLSGGQVCLFVSAAWGGLGPYTCQTQPNPIWADCRSPQPSQPWWTTDCQAQQTDSSPFAATQVTKIWF